MNTMEELERVFDDHPSLDASLVDFEPESPGLEASSRLSTHQSAHSGYRSDDSDSEKAEPPFGDAGGYSPPAWRRSHSGTRLTGFWHRSDGASQWSRNDSPSRWTGNREPSLRSGRIGGRNQREPSPEYDGLDNIEDATLAAALRTRLPTGSLSPEKGRSPSPNPDPVGGIEPARALSETKEVPVKNATPPGAPVPRGASTHENPNNYIRFAMRAEVHHRAEPFEAAFGYVTRKIDSITRSWTSLILSIFIAFLTSAVFRALFQPAAPLPVPDLVKVAGLARAFEPLIFYSENGVLQVGDLQATGIAVWDLGESVRTTNMTSAPIIVKELDDLSESLKTLSIELTKFFANVDGDVDGILIVMDWAKRELNQLSSTPPSALSSAFNNVYCFLSRVGVLETPAGTPTGLGQLTTSLLGQSVSQRTRKTLQRTFTEFLSVLEESIVNELTYSTALFTLFETIDQQFLNLARTVSRETDQQERLESDLLASLWTRVLGSNSANLKKYERNKALLSNVREKTVRNKHILVDHNGKLMTLKANLEMLRRKLVSPLVRSGNSSTLSIEDQIRGLDSTYEHLNRVREKQKGKLMEMLYGASSRSIRLGSTESERAEVDGRRAY